MKRIALLLVSLILTAAPAFAGTKEDMLRLQNDLVDVQNQVRSLQKSIDENGAISKTLLNQIIDQLSRTTRMVEDVKGTVDSQAKSGNDNVEDVLNEIRTLSAKVEDLSTRLSTLSRKVDTTVAALEDMKNRRPQAGTTPDGKPLPLPPDQLFQLAYSDYIQGNYELAIQGFQEYLGSYKDTEQSDNAQYYIGDCFFNQNKYKEAIAAFDKTVTDYPKGDKVPAALLKSGLASLNLKDTETAKQQFLSVFQKFPDSPEANIAHQQLQILGVTPPPRSKRR